jgi:hypothetical protein
MKLSVWAKESGLTYKTAWRMWRDGTLPIPAEQLATGDRPIERYLACYRRLGLSDAERVPPRLPAGRPLLAFLPYERRAPTRRGFRLFRVDDSACDLLGMWRRDNGRTRERSLTGLLPGKLDRWFGPLAGPRQRDLLLRHAPGGAYGAWFGSTATRPACHAADLPRQSRIRPLTRGKIPRGPRFSVRPPRRALYEDAGGRRRPPA